MNIALISAIISLAFLIGKLALTYKNADVKACIQDTVLVFISGAIGLYGYGKYGVTKLAEKKTEVFTEKPNF